MPKIDKMLYGLRTNKSGMDLTNSPIMAKVQSQLTKDRTETQEGTMTCPELPGWSVGQLKC